MPFYAIVKAHQLTLVHKLSSCDELYTGKADTQPVLATSDSWFGGSLWPKDSRSLFT